MQHSTCTCAFLDSMFGCAQKLCKAATEIVLVCNTCSLALVAIRHMYRRSVVQVTKLTCNFISLTYVQACHLVLFYIQACLLCIGSCRKQSNAHLSCKDAMCILLEELCSQGLLKVALERHKLGLRHFWRFFAVLQVASGLSATPTTPTLEAGVLHLAHVLSH